MAVPLLIQELVNMLPDLGQPFPPQQRERWLEAMSWRHMHVTSHLAGDPGLGAFLEAAHQLDGFELVSNVVWGGRVIAVVFYSKDLDDCSDEIYLMPETAEALTGLLEHDIVI